MARTIRRILLILVLLLIAGLAWPRAQMMRYRDDRRDGRMQPADWTPIEQNLIASYRELKTGVTRLP